MWTHGRQSVERSSRRRTRDIHLAKVTGAILSTILVRQRDEAFEREHRKITHAIEEEARRTASLMRTLIEGDDPLSISGYSLAPDCGPAEIADMLPVSWDSHSIIGHWRHYRLLR